jgi:hypothetical protein
VGGWRRGSKDSEGREGKAKRVLGGREKLNSTDHTCHSGKGWKGKRRSVESPALSYGLQATGYGLWRRATAAQWHGNGEQKTKLGRV